MNYLFSGARKVLPYVYGTVLLLSAFSTTGAYAQEQQAGTTQPAAIGASKIWGKVDGVDVIGLVQGPSSANVPLQVACVFEYTEGDIFNSPPALPAPLNGMVHLDEALHGLITDIRKSGRFAGYQNETLLITPPKGSMSAQRLLIIGLGKREQFNAGIMTEIGAIAAREALKLGVQRFAFASDIKDAGIDSPTALVAANVVKGIFGAYRTQVYLQSKQMSAHKPLTGVYLLAGPSFFTTAGTGIQEAIAALHQ